MKTLPSEHTAERLRSFYRDNQIAATYPPDEFRCRYFTKSDSPVDPPSKRFCLDTVRDASRFVTAYEACIGRYFGYPGVPRLVILSLDPGSTSPDEHADRSMKIYSSESDGCGLHETMGKRPREHWSQVHVLTRMILSRWISASLDREIDTLEACEWFAATNAVRCCANRPEAKEAPWGMYENCSYYIEGELKALEVDILVTLGQKALDITRLRLCPSRIPVSTRPPVHLRLELGGRPVEWIALTHPAADRYTIKGQAGPYAKQRDTFVPPCVDEIWSRWSNR